MSNFLKKEDITIGTQFIHRRKNRNDLCTVTDILRTYNSKDELVKVEYVAEHEFCGQKVTDTYVAVTIQRNHVAN